MTEWVRETHGAQARLLYPSWDTGCEHSERPRVDKANGTRPFTVAYAGNVFSEGYRVLISDLAEACRGLGFSLALFSNIPEHQRAVLGLDGKHVLFQPLVPAGELPSSLRACSDALFVPMSFENRDRRCMFLGFPSKLAECTGIGLPILIWGPEDCSAVRWARENPGAAEVVDQREQSSLEAALRKLASSPSYRRSLSQAAFASGRDLFSYEKVASCFFTELLMAVQRRVGSAV